MTIWQLLESLLDEYRSPVHRALHGLGNRLFIRVPRVRIQISVLAVGKYTATINSRPLDVTAHRTPWLSEIMVLLVCVGREELYMILVIIDEIPWNSKYSSKYGRGEWAWSLIRTLFLKTSFARQLFRFG